MRAAREDVAYRPGKDAHVRYAVDVERDGATAREGWVLCAGAGPGVGTHQLEGPSGPVAAWRVRDDPGLPGLRPALELGVVSELLQELGVPTSGLELELLAYRPQRRAVVAARTSVHELYLKCVPPQTAPLLHRRHAACAEAGLPVPRTVGYDPALGLLVLTPLPGQALRGLLLRGDAELPPPSQVTDLLDAFGRVELEVPARSPMRQARGHAQLLRALLPAQAGRVDDLLGRVQAGGAAPPATRVVHGDFYDDQLLVRSGRIAGVVDVDGAGLGHPADDAGNLLAHLLLLVELVPTASALHGWLPGALDQVSAPHDPQELRRRTAAVLLGLATWPHSQQVPAWQEQTRGILDLAERVLQTGR